MSRVEATPDRIEDLKSSWQTSYDTLTTSGENQDIIEQLQQKLDVLKLAPCTKCRFFALDERKNGRVGLVCKRYLSPVSLVQATPIGQEVYCRKFEQKGGK